MKKNNLKTPEHAMAKRSSPQMKFQPPNGMPLADDQPNQNSDFNSKYLGAGA